METRSVDRELFERLLYLSLRPLFFVRSFRKKGHLFGPAFKGPVRSFQVSHSSLCSFHVRVSLVSTALECDKQCPRKIKCETQRVLQTLKIFFFPPVCLVDSIFTHLLLQTPKITHVKFQVYSFISSRDNCNQTMPLLNFLIVTPQFDSTFKIHNFPLNVLVALIFALFILDVMKIKLR